MSRSAQSGREQQGLSILDRIDGALVSVPGLQSGTGVYQPYVPAADDQAALEAFRDLVVDLAAERYRSIAPDAELVEFHDGAFDMLFDLTGERTILAHGLSKATAPASRDGNYHRGYPARAGYDKGHAMAHAQGGREGGPNYFPQAPGVNRRLTPAGHLWRDIETYLAAHPGLFCFVRLLYPPDPLTDVPGQMEYGILCPLGFRAVIFTNK